MGVRSRCVLVALVSGLALPSCGPRATGSAVPDEVVVFPAPPDTARIQFLTRYTTSEDLGRSSRSSLWARLAGRNDATFDEIVKPYGIDIHDGRLYVCDTAMGIDVLDLRANTFDVWQPGGMGKLRQPINCTIDGETDRLYVADAGRNGVLIFDLDGRYLDAFGPGGDSKPVDVLIDGDRVLVAEMGGHRVAIYDKATLGEIGTIPADDDLRGKLYLPGNLAVTGDTVYVSDMGDFRVKAYTREGAFLGVVGTYGRGPGQFTRPKGLAADREGRIYAVDAAFENVQIFNRDWELLMWFGGTYTGPGGMSLPAKVAVDYDNVELFQEYVHPSFDLKYVIFVTNQFGPDRVSVYGFVEPKRRAVGGP